MSTLQCDSWADKESLFYHCGGASEFILYRAKTECSGRKCFLHLNNKRVIHRKMFKKKSILLDPYFLFQCILRSTFMETTHDSFEEFRESPVELWHSQSWTGSVPDSFRTICTLPVTLRTCSLRIGCLSQLFTRMSDPILRHSLLLTRYFAPSQIIQTLKHLLDSHKVTMQSVTVSSGLSRCKGKKMTF